MATEHPDYFGMGSVQNTSSSTVIMTAESAIYTNYQASTCPAGTVVTGAGGGTYTLQASAPVKNMVTTLLLGKDIAGNTRSGTQPAGCSL